MSAYTIQVVDHDFAQTRWSEIESFVWQKFQDAELV